MTCHCFKFISWLDLSGIEKTRTKKTRFLLITRATGTHQVVLRGFPEDYRLGHQTRFSVESLYNVYLGEVRELGSGRVVARLAYCAILATAAGLALSAPSWIFAHLSRLLWRAIIIPDGQNTVPRITYNAENFTTPPHGRQCEIRKKKFECAHDRRMQRDFLRRRVAHS